jgi:hypothetical protein
VYLFYVDDSAGGGHDLLTAVGVDARAWSTSLDRWLTFRRDLAAEHGLPKAYELHAGTFVTGRGRPNQADPRAAINRDHGLRRRIYEQALDVVTADTQLSVHTVHHVGRQDRDRIYRALLDHLEDWLAARDEVGLVAMDGNDQLYAKVHRNLPLDSRRIIEDAWLQESHSNQFIQVADLVVHAAFQSVVRQPARAFMWDWYPDRFPPPTTGPQREDPGGIG